MTQCYICGGEDHSERENIYTTKHTCPVCGTYYLELGFVNQVDRFRDLYGDKLYKDLKVVMGDKLKRNGTVVFTFDFTETFTEIEGAVYVEYEDLANAMGILNNDPNNRGTRHL
jgi:hypothetical protein